MKPKVCKNCKSEAVFIENNNNVTFNCFVKCKNSKPITGKTYKQAVENWNKENEYKN